MDGRSFFLKHVALWLWLSSAGCGERFQCTSSPIVIGTASVEIAEEEVVAASSRFLEALLAQDTATMGAMLSEMQAFEAASNGATFAGEDFLRAVEQGRFPVLSNDRLEMDSTAFAVTPEGSARVTYYGSGRLVDAGKRLRSGPFEIQMLLLNEGQGWRVTRLTQQAEARRGSLGW
jgi:hypothetical protein